MSNHEDRLITGSIVSTDPKIILVGLNGDERFSGSFLDCHQFMNVDERYYFFLNPMWSLASDSYRDRTFKAVVRAFETFPQHKYIALANDPNELDRCTSSLPPGIKTYICGEHCATDLTTFRYKKSPIIHDAAYIARADAYKRISLCSQIESVCLISRGITTSLFEQISVEVPGLVCLNICGSSVRQLTPDEVSGALHSSGCGLILSCREGQNRATIEYLLCGAPVVTTPSQGGRDRWLHPGNSIYAQASPAAVAEAVKFTRTQPFDRHEIARAAAICVLREREWLRYIINATLAEDGLLPIPQERFTLPHHAFSRTEHVHRHMDHIGRGSVQAYAQ